MSHKDELGRVICHHGRPFTCAECGEEYAAETDAPVAQPKDDAQALLEALRRVRAHTSYINPTIELLQGLLRSIERIADTALAVERTRPIVTHYCSDGVQACDFDATSNSYVCPVCAAEIQVSAPTTTDQP